MRRIALPGAVLLALLVVFLIGQVTQPAPARTVVQGGQSADVGSIARSCPPLAAGTAAGGITMIALPPHAADGASAAAPAAATSAGDATFRAIVAARVAGGGPASGKAAPSGTASPSGKPSASAETGTKTTEPSVSAPGMVETLQVSGGDGAAVAATGRMAEGFEAEQSDASGTGLVSCTHPGSDMWFAGAGQSDGATQTRLYLMNTGNVAASVDVTILTDTGQQNGLSNAITVAPGQFVTENVAPFMSGSQALALHVQTTAGQVAASVWQGGASGGAWLPQAAAPATTLVIPGLTVASSAAKLFVVVPGSTDAQVKVVAYTPAGAVPQFPSAPVDASAGAATPVSLNSLGAAAAGLRLTSNVPIVAGVLVPGTGMGAFTTAVPPVTEQGVVAGNPSARGVTVGLLLTAPSAAARASISVIGPDGTVTTPLGGGSVTIAAGHTLAVAVPRPAGAREPFAIVVTPQAGSGPLYAVRAVTSGTGGLSAPVTSLLPVPSALASINLPPAENSYSAVMPLPPHGGSGSGGCAGCARRRTRTGCPWRDLPGEYGRLARGSASWCDEARFVGKHDGLDTVAEAELGQYPPDVDLDRAFGEVQLGGDLAVGPPGGELGENGTFPVGELAERRVAVLLLARVG
jgi:uncharacterized protein DUF5719